VITLDHIRKTFGMTIAVNNVSFVACDGQVTGLLGPNGAGKTTLLRTLGGLLLPDSGRVLVDGTDVHRAPLHARARLGVLPESAGLYDRLTVREHLLYAGRLHGHQGQELAGRVGSLLERTDLTGSADKRAAVLSLGQRRRVALARCLVHDPRNVVLDEPTNGLDVLGVRSVRAEIRRLAAAGCAVIVSTHVMPEISAVCDRIVIMAKGQVVSDGTPEEIQERAGVSSMEEAFVRTIGSAEGLN
jgi:sodium transport system ATP-binding protein